MNKGNTIEQLDSLTGYMQFKGGLLNARWQQTYQVNPLFLVVCLLKKRGLSRNKLQNEMK